ncbi:hypothetical protein [Flagellimonas olearia]|uniref:Transcriptional coactivator p15 (PC4) C-terminal domain-containing protein n=1 Tax=Flagellimonas olearia TaxID=552546 RepID=A0A444VJV2_9FLAO|nr:hypothetical protein [Allomuricauda olearia]RYC51048.1 hypothetical protein DN53_15545 [Allomuricauda olearia]
MKPDQKYKIEYQKLLKEVRTKSYEVVRLTRIKYFGNDHNFVDIRFYQRGFDDSGDEIYFPTKKGVQIKEELFMQIFDQYFIDNIENILNN